MNITTILDLITARETATSQATTQIREQIAQLTARLAQLDRELADLATTRTTLRTITTTEFTTDDPTIASAPYQQILTVLTTTATAMRARDICVALEVDPTPKQVESTRAKLKRMAGRGVLTETEPGMFTLAPKQA